MGSVRFGIVILIAALSLTLPVSAQVRGPEELVGKWYDSNHQVCTIRVNGGQIAIDMPETVADPGYTTRSKSITYVGQFNPSMMHLTAPLNENNVNTVIPVTVAQQSAASGLIWKADMTFPQQGKIHISIANPYVAYDSSNKLTGMGYSGTFEIDLDRGGTYSIGHIRVEDLIQRQKIGPLKKQIQDLMNNRIPQAEQEKTRLKQQYDAEKATFEQLYKQKAQLEEQIHTKLKQYGDLQFLADRQKALEDRLNDIAKQQAQCKGSMSCQQAMAQENAILKELSDLKDKAKTVDPGAKDQAKADLDAAQTAYTPLEGDVEFHNDTFNQLSQQLADTQDRLDGLNTKLLDLQNELRLVLSTPSIEGVQVNAEGKTVYKVTWAKTKEELDLQDQIDRTTDLLMREKAIKEKAFKEFKDANKAALDAGKKLSGDGGWLGGGEIMKAAYLNAAVESAYYAYDVGKAWGKGGPYGALAEAGKKWVEAQVFSNQNYGSTADPDSIEAEIQKAYGASVDNAASSNFRRTTAEKILVERSFKETVSSFYKGQVNNNISAPWQKNLISGTQSQQQSLENFIRNQAKSGQMEDALNKMTANANRLEKLNNQLTDLQKVKGQGIDWQNAAEGVVKDVSKAGLKYWASSGERDAWYDYFKKNLDAQMLYPAYQVAATEFNHTADYLEALQDVQKEMLNGADPKPDFKEVVNEPFNANINLDITLNLRQEAQSYKERVLLSNQVTSYKAPHEFELTVPDNLPRDPSGRLWLNVEQFDKPGIGWNPITYSPSQAHH